MSVRSLCLIFVAAVVLAAPACARAALPGWTGSTDPAEARARLAMEKRVDSFTIIQRNERYRVNISYPSIGNAVADEELAIWARDQANAFIKGVEQISPSSPLPYELAIAYDMHVASPRVLSIIFTISTALGGARPESGLATFVYDRRDGRRLTYDTLFLQRDGLLQALSEACVKSLREQLHEKAHPDMIKAGTAPEIVNFDLFTLSPQGLVVYFPPYQVAPYSEGVMKVAIPVQSLEAFKPQLSFWNKEPGR